MNNEATIPSPSDRLRHLEDQARLTLDVLDMAASLSDFQALVNRNAMPEQILREAHARINGLVDFTTTSFLLVSEKNSDFYNALCLPDQDKACVDAEVQQLVEKGLFALAIRENKPITVYSQDGRFRIVLCVLATTTRVRGMFIGMQPRSARNTSAVLLTLLRLVLRQVSNAIECHELRALHDRHARQEETLLDGLGVPVFETDAAGVFRHMNNAARVLATQVAAGDVGLLDVVHADERDALGMYISDAMQQGRPIQQNCRLIGSLSLSTSVVLHLAPVTNGNRCIGLRGVMLPCAPADTNPTDTNPAATE